MSQATFTGKENLDEILTDLPVKFQKSVMIKIFDKASSKFLSSAKSSFNGSLKEAVRRIHLKSEKYPGIIVGLVKKKSGRTRSGKEIKGNEWQYLRAYWRNFGTLSNRDSGHSFAQARRTISSKYKGGIKATLNIGTAWEASQAEALKIIKEESSKIAIDLLIKKAKRK